MKTYGLKSRNKNLENKTTKDLEGDESRSTHCVNSKVRNSKETRKLEIVINEM